ncbi:hypothetical protein C8R44DRAFT_743501 [Mycena epipterygia]|nr:hypothetical protein C8R44DRAFT_743501 [Mycena epipterygia]
MTRILSIFEGKETKRVRIEAKIVERSEQFRVSPTVKIGSVTAINPIFEGPNPFQVPELLDPENEGVLLAPVECPPDSASVRWPKKRRDRAKSEAYKKTPWPLENEESRRVQSVEVARYSAPPLTEYMSDDDPFHKEPLSRYTVADGRKVGSGATW